MVELSFIPNRSKAPRQHGAVQIGKGSKAKNYRITHVFNTSVYLIPVTTAAKGHDAPRPKRTNRRDLQDQVSSGNARYGTIRLPPEMLIPVDEASVAKRVREAKAEIQPLLNIFSREADLGRSFTSEIKTRAAALKVAMSTLRRALLRYWYFGAVDQSLLMLRRGPQITVPVDEALRASSPTKPSTLLKRRAGRKPVFGSTIRLCDWSPTAVDVKDMERAAIRCTRKRKKGLQAVTDDYLQNEFKRRHPTLYEQFVSGSISPPCTERQLKYRLRRKAALDPRVAKAFPSLARREGTRVLQAVGSGHMYELDATGGQIYIVDSKDPTRVLRKVTIYLAIDRYSRYVVSCYITAKAPSSAGVRQALRIAFTSRRRFQNMGVDIDDNDWPPGVVPMVLVVDNGPDMISMETLEIAVKDLHIHADILPPYTPDGKAIIERFIKTLKLKMRAKGLGGLYKKFQTSPEDKQQAKDAVYLAEYSLRGLYRELIEIIRQYNNEHHAGLKARLPELAATGVPFTPIAAYKYGLEQVSGLERPPISDEDIYQLTLRSYKARIKDGLVTWQNLSFNPANKSAVAWATNLGPGSKCINVKLDASDPVELFVTSSLEPTPRWHIDRHGAAFVAAVNMEDWDEFSPERLALENDTLRKGTIARLQAAQASNGSESPKPRRKAATDPKTVQRRSVQESNELDASLNAGRKSERADRAAKPAVNTRKAQPIDFQTAEAARLEAIATRSAARGKR